MLAGICHCGAVRLEVPDKPRRLVDCNCSICRRYAPLWAYYLVRRVRVHAPRGALEAYAWGRRTLEFVRCRRCGCVTHWRPANSKRTRIGVNFRNFEPDDVAGIRVRRLDGAKSWRYLD